MNRRDNGLQATAWAPLADVESALTDHVLDALATAGIAAYADPATSGEAVYLGAGRSTGPSDRITVDRDLRREARAVIDGLLPELRAELADQRRTSEDSTWTQIVAGLESPTTEAEAGQGGSWPAAEDLPKNSGDQDDAPRADEWAGLRPEPREPTLPRELVDVDDDEHFIPPPAPPVPAADAVTRAAWTGVIGGPLFIILSALLGRQNDDLVLLMAVGAFVGGFITLVARMKDRPPLDESGDDGAVV